MKYQSLVLTAACLTMTACGESRAPAAVDVTDKSVTTMERENPLLANWETPFGVPPFDLIESTDYLPALREGMQQRKKEIDAIVTNPDAPTFENTIVALEVSGGTLGKVRRPFFRG